MEFNLDTVLLIVATGLFIAAGFTYPRGNPPSIHLGWFGLACVAIAML